MNRIKRISYEVLDKHKSKFNEDFAENKKILDQVSIIRSKSLKNKTAGYITKFIKKEIREEKDKQARISYSQSEESTVQEIKTETVEPITISEETPVEETTVETPVEDKTETTEDKPE